MIFNNRAKTIRGRKIKLLGLLMQESLSTITKMGSSLQCNLLCSNEFTQFFKLEKISWMGTVLRCPGKKMLQLNKALHTIKCLKCFLITVLNIGYIRSIDQLQFKNFDHTLISNWAQKHLSVRLNKFRKYRNLFRAL